MERNEKLIRMKLWQYLLPSIMMTAALQMGNIVDTMLVGNLGVGGSVAVGILLGKRERDKANRVFSMTLTVSVLCGIVFALLSVTSPVLAEALTGGGSLTADVRAFIFVTLLGAPVISLALQFMNYVAVDNNPSVASAYVIVSNVINLALDYLILKYTALGTAGAALSTVLGYGIAMLVLIRYLRSPKRMLKYVFPFGRGGLASGAEFMLALSTGMPTLLYMVFLTTKDLGLNTMIVRMIGNDGMAVYTVCANVVLLVELLVGGIIGTIASIGGVIYGEKDYFGIRSLVKHVLIYSYAVLLVILIILWVFPQYVVALFGITEGVLSSMASAALRIFVCSLPFYLLNKFMTTYYQSTEQTKLSGIVTSLQTCVAILPLAVVFTLAAKAAGFDLLNALMAAFVASEIVTIVIAFIYRKLKYKDQGFLLLPEKEEEAVYDISAAADLEEVEKVPREIIGFCKAHQVDAGRANLLAVAAEEMLVNIIRYGGKKVDTIDINLRIADDTLLFRLRDNGIPFDPTDYSVDSGEYEIHGIEVVRSITDRMQYMRVLDLNHTVIEMKKS